MSDILEIDTKGVCLLCLNACTASPALSTIHGFEKLLRYLKVNTTQLFNCSPQLLQLMEIKEDIVMGVTLCSACALVTQNFDQLYKQYELLRIQFDNCVQSVHQSIKTGHESPDRVREYTKRMKPQHLTEILNCSLATNLRNETFKKCSSKLQSSIPRVSVPKIGSTRLAMGGSQRLSTADIPVEVIQSQNETDSSRTEQIGLEDMHEDEIIIEDSDSDDNFSEEELEFSLYDRSPTQPSTWGSATLCPICSANLTRASLREHTMTLHPETILSPYFPPDSSFDCTEQLCKSALDLLLSNVSTTGVGHICPYCPYSNKRRSKLKYHIMSIHASTVATHVMQFARRSQNQLDEMDDTEQDPLAMEGSPSTATSHPSPLSTPKEIMVVKCGGCQKYVSTDHFNGHLPQCQEQAPATRNKCAICKKNYASKAQLNKHMLCHTRQHKCPHCPQSCSTVSNLKCHVQEVHVVEDAMLHLPPEVKVQCAQVVEGMLEELRQVSTLRCMHCDLKAASRRNLRKHVLGTHHDQFLEELRRRLGLGPEVDGGQVEGEEGSISIVKMEAGTTQENESLFNFDLI